MRLSDQRSHPQAPETAADWENALRASLPAVPFPSPEGIAVSCATRNGFDLTLFAGVGKAAPGTRGWSMNLLLIVPSEPSSPTPPIKIEFQNFQGVVAHVDGLCFYHSTFPAVFKGGDVATAEHALQDLMKVCHRIFAGPHRTFDATGTDYEELKYAGPIHLKAGAASFDQQLKVIRAVTARLSEGQGNQ